MAVLPNLSIVAAVAENGVIGLDNRLPWHLPADLARFKRLTMGKPIIMGRRTWDSLPGLLPHRTHVVVSRNSALRAEGAQVARGLDYALALVGDADEVMVIGGAELYRQALPLCARMHLTLVHADMQGDTFFPEYDPVDWVEVSRQPHPANERNPHDFSFVELRRRLAGT
jgi:dihydrofolate reductase